MLYHLNIASRAPKCCYHVSVCVCAVATRLVQFAGFIHHIKAHSLATNFVAIICANSQRASRITAAIRGCCVKALIHLLSLTTCVLGKRCRYIFLVCCHSNHSLS